MAIDAGAALREGASDLANARGLVLYVAFAIFAVLTLPIHQTLTNDMYAWVVEVAAVSPDQLVVPPTPLALDLSPAILVAALAVVFLVAEALRLFAIRALASDASEAVPVGEITRRLGPTYGVLLAVSLVVQVLVYGGVAIFIIPGLIAAVLTVFVRQAVVLDDAGPLEAFRTSISMVTNDVLNVGGLLVVLLAASFIVGIPTIVIDPGSVVRPVVGTILGSVVTVYGVAVLTRAYQQARDHEDGERDDVLGPDDLDEDGTGRTEPAP